jgi:hypothetical protein
MWGADGVVLMDTPSVFCAFGKRLNNRAAVKNPNLFFKVFMLISSFLKFLFFLLCGACSYSIGL